MLARILRKLAFGALTAIVLAGVDGSMASLRADPADVTVDSGDAVSREVNIGQDKSVFVVLPRDARDVLVSNPEIADAVIRTPRRIYLTALKAGQTNVIVFDRAGMPIVSLEIKVEDGGGSASLEKLLSQLIPGSAIHVKYIGQKNIVLYGTVKSELDARKAQDIADASQGAKPPPGTNSSSTAVSGTTISVGGGSSGGGSSSSTETITSGPSAQFKVINLLTIEGEEQVYLKVTVAEVQRNAIKQLGIDLNGGITLGQFKAAFDNTNPFPVNAIPPSGSLGQAGSGDPFAGISGLSDFNRGIFGTIRALEQTGMVRTLAEPTLTAISGESATFLAGGEFPVPTGRDKDGIITITYKPFGVGLSFTPIVLTEGRISLHVKTEVSDLSTENAFQARGLTLPALVVRRSESTIELPSGGSMVMGGLLQDNIRQTISGFPGLQKLPVIGTLFRSRDFKRNETELVIIVTPYLVKPVARTALARPDDGFNPASDGMSDFLGRINRVYGAKGKPAPAGNYTGKYGFIFE